MKLKIKGLDCANCAMKIEDALKKDSRLSNVVVDFVNQSISYDGNVDVKEVEAIVTKIEPDVTFINSKKISYNIEGLD